MLLWWLPVDLPNISTNTDCFEVWLVLIERSFQELSVAIETVRIIEELVEIWPNEVCDTASIHPPPLSMARLPPVPPLPVTLKPLPPALSIGVPIDVDATRKTRSLSLWGCYWCGDANHLVWDCSHCMDVHQLTAEQWEELIEDLLVLKDVVLIEESCPPEKEKDFA